MSDMRINGLAFDRGIDGISYASRDAGGQHLPERQELAPPADGVRAQLAQLLDKPTAARYLDDSLRPPLANRDLLMPAKFQQALQSALDGLGAAAEQHSGAVALQVRHRGAVQLDALERVAGQVRGGHHLADQAAGDRHRLVVEVLDAGLADLGGDGLERCGVALAVFVERGHGGGVGGHRFSFRVRLPAPGPSGPRAGRGVGRVGG